MKGNSHSKWMKADAPFSYRLHSDPSSLHRAKVNAVSSDAIAFTPEPFRRIARGEQIYLDLKVPGEPAPVTLSAQLEESDAKPLVARLPQTDTPHRRRLHPVLSQLVARSTWDAAAQIQSQSRLVTRTAANTEDYMSAARLLYLEYRLRGYCKERSDQLYFTHFALFPQSRTFLVEDAPSLLGTMSLVPDSGFGLPCEGVYPEKVSELRRSGRKLAELSLVALNGSHANVRHSYLLADPFKLLVFISLAKTLFDDARAQGVTDVLVATHPDNDPTYRFLLFERIGGLRSYSSAGGNPAILLQADLAKIRRNFAIPKDVLFPQMEMGLARYLYNYGATCGTGVTGQLVWSLLQQGENLQEDVADYFGRLFPVRRQMKVASR